MMTFDKLKRGMLLFSRTPQGGMSNIVQVERINKCSVLVQHLLDDFSLPRPPWSCYSARELRVRWSKSEVTRLLHSYWSVRPGTRWEIYIPGFRKTYKATLAAAEKARKGDG